MRPGILPEHGFKHKGNHYASLPWFGTKIAQKYAIKGSKFSGFRRDVKPHVLTFSTSGRRLVTTFCTCAMSSQKKCHVSGCRRQAGDVCCLRCLNVMSNDTRCSRMMEMKVPDFVSTILILAVGSNPIQVLLIRSDLVRVLSIRSNPIWFGFCQRPILFDKNSSSR